jgi:FAD-dependent urate hydroxylase
VPADEVLIIGAGPFGLSIAAHLRAAGIAHRIVGRPMDTWKAHCPPGMMLRSEPYGSDLAAPQPGWDVRAYCQKHGLDYEHRLGPLSIERFLDYADWYTRELVPDVSDLTVTGITPAGTGGGFRVTFADADPVTAGQVVVATGVLPYAVLPPELDGLPPELVSHTRDHHLLSAFAGRRVAVVGGGQSALETAALLHEAGAQVQVVMRRAAPAWLEPNPEHIRGLGYVRRPVNKLCEGWHCEFWNSPFLFRRLPREMRIDKARTVLGPAGAWWLKPRVDGVIDVLTGHHLKHAEPGPSGVVMYLDGPARSSVEADHVIAGTGFRIDLARLPFLGEELRAGITTLNKYPVVGRDGQSSVPGLYFAGAPTAVSLGPSVRFIAGTHNVARQMTRSLTRSGRPAARRPAEVRQPAGQAAAGRPRP